MDTSKYMYSKSQLKFIIYCKYISVFLLVLGIFVVGVYNRSLLLKNKNEIAEKISILKTENNRTHENKLVEPELSNINSTQVSNFNNDTLNTQILTKGDSSKIENNKNINPVKISEDAKISESTTNKNLTIDNFPYFKVEYPESWEVSLLESESEFVGLKDYTVELKKADSEFHVHLYPLRLGGCPERSDNIKPEIVFRTTNGFNEYRYLDDHFNIVYDEMQPMCGFDTTIETGLAVNQFSQASKTKDSWIMDSLGIQNVEYFALIDGRIDVGNSDSVKEIRDIVSQSVFD
jgi:hypothetical protein